MPNVIYSFVAQKNVVLVDYTTFSGNFSTVAIQCLQKCPETNSRFTYSCDKHTFNFLVESGFTFLCVAEEDLGRQIPFAFLQRLKDDFISKHGQAATEASAITSSLDRSYGPRLKELMDQVSKNPEEFSKIAQVKQQVEEVKNIMMDNIEKVLDRGDRIELLVDKTEELRFQADTFYRSGRNLRRKMWWNNIKMKLLIAFVVLLILVIIFCSFCFTGGKNCLK
uniref:V-SNARE coiled-coil homology domain-containing protein n=1 Tax=Pyramimonas obovata TaxID=1411642 RepID=A0A7S0RCA4_9CHLO|eukprot:CAMPEP_0118936676 /NCGR_PEP_ID=MMETSP1169-20130426/19963_1 /TAXON_ID=36882 /ORGANISM="Pyramimonas obovata, Strain CCMP722" /LENGTH=222 /DNA_ID=CAMNT_0006880011 /DNA_START=57 /DNA_END=725 /DNA_ORIENTATION=+